MRTCGILYGIGCAVVFVVSQIMVPVSPDLASAQEMQLAERGAKSGSMKEGCGKNCKSNQATKDDVASNGLDCTKGTVCQKENGKCSVGNEQSGEKGNCRTLMNGNSGECACFCAVEKQEL